MQEFWNQIVGFATAKGITLLASIIILIVGLKLISVLIKLLAKHKAFTQIDQSVQSFLLSFISIALKIILFLTIAAMLGMDMTSLVAMLASAGLAVGLALQGALANLAGGLMILIFKPFRVGDYIDTHSDSGTVAEITVFYTILQTPDNRRITVPNGALTNASIINYSSEKTRRLDLTFTVAYGSDIEQVKSLLLSVASAHPASLADPEPFARISAHREKEFALDFTLRVWCNAEDFWDLHFDLLENVKKEFAVQNIEIPNPKLAVHMNP